MTTQISDYPNVSERLAALGAKYPSGLALLPANFESANSIAEFRQVSEAATVKTLFRNAGLLQSDLVEKAQRPPYIQNNAFDLILPTVFVSAALWSENQNYISVALSLIANYATDFFKGLSGTKNVKLDVVVERSKSKTCKRISYSGPAEGLKDLAEVIRTESDE